MIRTLHGTMNSFNFTSKLGFKQFLHWSPLQAIQTGSLLVVMHLGFDLKKRTAKLSH